MHLNFINWGLKAYDEALKEQEEILNKKVNQKLLEDQAYEIQWSSFLYKILFY